MSDEGLRREVDVTDTVRYFNSEGQLHRLDGPAFEGSDGYKEWWVDGKYHRLDGPAIEDSDGSKEWWVDGQRHRLDGPAVEYSDGSEEYWIEGKYYKTKEDWENAICPSLEMVREMFKNLTI